jgi:hypothetical protein
LVLLTSFPVSDDSFTSALSADSSVEAGDEAAGDTRAQYLASIDQQFQRDVSAVLFGFFDAIRYYTKLIFIMIFLTALAHGVFIVMLALKLDGNSIFNWNVTLMPLTLYYGLWFIISVVGFASLPIFTLTADQYMHAIKTAIDFSWLIPALDRRIQLERVRLSSEFRKVIANMLPVKDIARWVNGYVETNLVGKDATLATTLAAVERGNRLLQSRIDKQQELVKKLEALANAGADANVGQRKEKPAGAAPRAHSLRSTAPPSISVNDVPAAAVPSVALPKIHSDPPPSDQLPSPKPQRATLADAVLKVTDALARRLADHHVVEQAAPPPSASETARAAASDGNNDDDDEESEIDGAAEDLPQGVAEGDAGATPADKVADGASVARHLLRAVRREISSRSKRASSAASAAASPLAQQASLLLEKAASDLSASDGEVEPSSLPSVSELAETLGNVDEATLRAVASNLKSYVSAKLPGSAPVPATSLPVPAPVVAVDAVSVDEPVRRRRRRTTTKPVSMGSFLRSVLVGSARDLFGSAAAHRERAGSVIGEAVPAASGALHSAAASVNAAVSGAMNAATVRAGNVAHTVSNALPGVAHAVESAVPADGVIDAFMSRGTKKDTKEKADLRKATVVSLGRQALAECAPELLVLVHDVNNALTGASNTLHAVSRLLRGAHDSAVFAAQMTHDLSTATTPVDALDRLGRWIRHQALSQAPPDSLSRSLEERAMQRRLLAQQQQQEQQQQSDQVPDEDDDNDDEEEADEELVFKTAPSPMRHRRQSPSSGTPTRRAARARAQSPLVFSNEQHRSDEDDDEDGDGDSEEGIRIALKPFASRREQRQ